MLDGVAYAVETIESLIPEVSAMLPARMAEYEVYGPPLEAAPNYDTYLKLAGVGMMIGVSIRDRGELIGYWLGMKFPDPHHVMAGRRVMVFMSQAFHVLPEWRAKIAPSFFRYLEGVCRERGGDLLAQRIRPLERSEGYLEAKGYQLSEVVYVKRLF